MRLIPLLSLGLLAGLPVTAFSPLRPSDACTRTSGLDLPDGFCAVLVGSDLGEVRHITIAPNGDIFAAVEGGEGVLALRDTNGDGVREMANGEPIAFTFITNVENKTRVELSTIIATDLRAIGIQATPQSVDFNTLVTQLNDSFQYEACLLGFTGSIHPITSMNMWRSSGRTHAWNSLQQTPATPWEAEIDKLASDFSQALDLNSQQKAIFEMQRIFAENVPMVPLYTTKEFMAVRNKFGNVRPTPFSENFWNADELFVK